MTRKWWIYKITNPKGYVYIGKSSNVKSRFVTYKNITTACHSQPLILNSLKKYGSDNHTFEIIDEFESDNTYASGKEMFWIRSNMSNRNKWRDGIGLNLSDGGEGNIGVKFVNRVSPNKGKKLSLERVEQIKEWHRLNPQKPVMEGRKHTDESKAKMSKSKKGKVYPHMLLRTISDEHRERLRVINTGKPSPNKGKSVWGEEDKKRIGDSKRGNTYNKGRKHGEEIKKSMSISQRKRRGISIDQYDLNGFFLKNFNCFKDIENETGMADNSIRKILSGVIKNPKQFIFKYANKC